MPNPWPFALPVTEGELYQNSAGVLQSVAQSAQSALADLSTARQQLAVKSPNLTVWVWIILAVGLLVLITVIVLVIYFSQRQPQAYLIESERLHPQRQLHDETLIQTQY